MRPLYYSMLLLFKDGKERCVNDVINELKGEYGHFKMLKFPAVQEGLMTAQNNGLLDETRFDLDEEGKLRVYWKVNDYGMQMINGYIK
ncbi:hypothetical protein LI036_01950 [bacterium 210917-DFI.7.65]|nr:hypothetical protein [Clostridiales bacterium]MCB6898895.1 hypothetical protein [bacterium 210917-DFI.7.65]